MTWPRTSIGLVDKVYDGEWFEGKMSGHGRMRWVVFILLISFQKI